MLGYRDFFYLNFLFSTRFLIFRNQLLPFLFSQLLKKILITPQLLLSLIFELQPLLFRRTVFPRIVTWKISAFFRLQLFKRLWIMLLKKVHFFLDAYFMVGTILANFLHTSLRLHPLYRQLVRLCNLYALKTFRVILHLYFWIRDIFSSLFFLIVAVIFTNKVHCFLRRTDTWICPWWF